MNTMTLTFDIPDSKHFDSQAFKEKMQEIAKLFLSIPSAFRREENDLEKDTDEMHIFDVFDNGAWYNDPRDAHEIAEELHNSRYFRDRSVEPW